MDITRLPGRTPTRSQLVRANGFVFTVAISDNGRFAVERGHWRGRFHQADGGIAGNSGLHQAGWIKRGGVWLIRTESYIRLHCLSESDCPK